MGVFLLVLISMTGVAIMWRVMAFETVYTGEMAGSPLAPQRTLPPSPRLQTYETTTGDLAATHEAEDKLLRGEASWVDKEKGVVRIPIDRAIELLAKRGLPATPPQKPGAKQ